jgi:hypothetical protein
MRAGCDGVLRALGINKIDPPIPPKPGETIV